MVSLYARKFGLSFVIVSRCFYSSIADFPFNEKQRLIIANFDVITRKIEPSALESLKLLCSVACLSCF